MVLADMALGYSGARKITAAAAAGCSQVMVQKWRHLLKGIWTWVRECMEEQKPLHFAWRLVPENVQTSCMTSGVAVGPSENSGDQTL